MREKYNREYFNRHRTVLGSCRKGGYAGYEKQMCEKHWKMHVNKILEYVDNGKILDVGCAYGTFLMAMPDSFEKFGADISHHAIEKARGMNPSFKFEVADIGKTTKIFPGNKFGAVTLFDTIEHLTNLENALKNISELLNDAGYVFVMVPIASKFHHLISAFGFGLMHNDVSHIAIAKKETWCGLFDSYFRVVEDFPITLGSRYIWPLDIYHFFVLRK